MYTHMCIDTRVYMHICSPTPTPSHGGGEDDPYPSIHASIHPYIHCTTLHCIAKDCTTPYDITLNCIALHYVALGTVDICTYVVIIMPV